MKQPLCKYLIFQSFGILEAPIIFPDYIDHSAVARMITVQYGGGDIVAGGFVYLKAVVIEGTSKIRSHAYGESISTKKTSRGVQDADIIDRWLNNE